MTTVVASNRLPVRLDASAGTIDLQPTTGGLVSALAGVARDATWIGWPGAVVPEPLQAAARERLHELGMAPVFLDAEEEREFYGRACNDTIWPLFHYFGDRLRLTSGSWASYVRVNERFAEAIDAASALGGTVWVHDFHLMLVPELLRRRRPDLTIGFFLHIPFPSSEVYRLLPAREEVLRGLLGADYVSFHTREYANHFLSSCLRVLGLDSEPEAIRVDGRTVTVGVDPIGIDVAGFEASVASVRAREIHDTVDGRYRSRRLVLGVERLDYSKGIPQKLRAFERYLESHPDEVAAVTMLQVLVPSRLDSPEYQALRDEIEREIARINGRFAQPGVTPIEYLHRSVGRDELAALYRRADAMLVTPLRDGMNLVAQEFALSQAVEGAGERCRGALVLSELAGAATVLPGAFLVNPWDIDATAEAIAAALRLSPRERARRMHLMAERVRDLAADRWAARYLRRLRRAASARGGVVPRLEGDALASLGGRFRDAAGRVVVLDYDGALREFERTPELATPTDAVLELLDELAALPDTEVHVVSGRSEAELDEWLGDLRVHLCAEHGLAVRAPSGPWRRTADPDLSWLPSTRRLLQRVAQDVPGAVVEVKPSGVAWHHRDAEPSYGTWRARELRLLLARHLSRSAADVITGDRVVEVRPRGVSKAAYVARVVPAGRSPEAAVVLGAEDGGASDGFLAQLPAGSVAVLVGPACSAARIGCDAYRVEGPVELRAVLGALADAVARRPALVAG
jgi:trehalose 6-phosphate synthase/phosphatase